ncbi:hypothetical protein QOT17_006372, partial [Balamuthia mandrillaris]
MGEEHGILGVYSRGVPLQAVMMITTPHPHLKQLGYVFRMAVDASIWALRDVTTKRCSGHSSKQKPVTSMTPNTKIDSLLVEVAALRSNLSLTLPAPPP